MEGRRRIPALGDLGAAANPLRLLSELAADLRVISKHTVHMDREVTGMHASVERIEDEMRALTDRIGALDERMAAVEGAVERLEPYVADLNLALRPLRRARARFPKAAPADAAEIVAEAAADADDEPPAERSATG
jgi:chromosome segregation ATPase